jgi:hypothetical protein
MRDGSRIGSGLRRIPYATLKTLVVAPIPSASVRTAALPRRGDCRVHMKPED